MERVWQILLDSFFRILIPGIKVTIPLTLISFSIGMIIATIVALVQFANITFLKPLCRFYIWIIRGTPLLVQLYVVFFGLPSIGLVIDPLPAAIIVFSINEGAYSAETIRAALQSIDSGQIEAGYCLSMSYLQIIFHVVLPQALRNAFPSLSNSLIAMIKDSSLASNIMVVEMFMTTQRILADTWEPLALYIEVGLIYLIFSTVLTKLQAIGEKKLGNFIQE